MSPAQISKVNIPKDSPITTCLCACQEFTRPTAGFKPGSSEFTSDHPGYPPTMLIHGTADELVPTLATIVMYEALAEAGVPVEVHLYADQPHGFDAQPAFCRQCAAEMLHFLDRYVRHPVAAGA